MTKGVPRRRLLSAGEGFLGALGGGDFAARRTLEPVVPPASLASLEMARVRAGWAHAAAVTRCGRLFVWGRPFDFATVMRLNRLHAMWPPLAALVNQTAAALGARDDGGAESAFRQGVVLRPTEVPLPDGEAAVDVACGAGLTSVLCASGAAYSFGLNGYAQCGGGHEGMHEIAPIRVLAPAPAAGGAPPRLTQLALGFQHGLALAEDGAVIAWGKFDRGQLGGAQLTADPLPSMSGALDVPARVLALDADAVAVGAGFNHGAAVTADGRAHVWGKMQGAEPQEDRARAGLDVYSDAKKPRALELPDGLRAIGVACSSFQTALATDDGGLWLMGREPLTRATWPQPTPVKMPSAPGAALAPAEVAARLRPGIDAVSWLAPDGSALRLVLQADGAVAVPLARAEDGYAIEDVALGWRFSIALGDAE